mmetsp:Transcript_8438/g.12450  ORF Transcript_8438/g.12450 Transcript_8438/m.12450 type:complete len:259 (+) Transcript_8438:43-819(+)
MKGFSTDETVWHRNHSEISPSSRDQREEKSEFDEGPTMKWLDPSTRTLKSDSEDTTEAETLVTNRTDSSHSTSQCTSDSDKTKNEVAGATNEPTKSGSSDLFDDFGSDCGRVHDCRNFEVETNKSDENESKQLMKLLLAEKETRIVSLEGELDRSKRIIEEIAAVLSICDERGECRPLLDSISPDYFHKPIKPTHNNHDYLRENKFERTNDFPKSTSWLKKKVKNLKRKQKTTRGKVAEGYNNIRQGIEKDEEDERCE